MKQRGERRRKLETSCEELLSLKAVEASDRNRLRRRREQRKKKNAKISSLLVISSSVLCVFVIVVVWIIYKPKSPNIRMQTLRQNSTKADGLQQTGSRLRLHHFDDDERHHDGLQIAWLMSFPNSGTSYTSRLVRDTSMTFSGSNYADETPTGAQSGVQEAIFPNDQPTGPFWIKPEASLDEFTEPTRYVLTKTHCGIRCTLCPPEEYAETTYSFRRRCLVTKWINTNTNNNNDTSNHHQAQYSTYPSDRVKKAVHLFRDPFDNVVSRFHMERQVPNRTAKNYPFNRQGFLQYCLSIDGLYVDSEIKYMHFRDNPILADLWMVPCYADFLRYIEWHNLAFFTTDDLELETYVLHFEWYSTTQQGQERFFNETLLSELLDFLELEQRAAPAAAFVPGKVYRDYFSDDEKRIVQRAFEFMASRKTWQHVQQYFLLLPPSPATPPG